MNDLITLNKNNCKNCYKCIRNCPVKSIEFSGHQANVLVDECVLCGRCYVNCPQHAKDIRTDLEKARVLIQQNERVVASIAPSFVANYRGASMTSMRKALRTLGFMDVEETAMGAQLVKNDYERYIDDHEPNVFITSACHSINLMIQKYYPSLIKYLAPIQSPMQAHAVDIKERFPEAKVIFIGPCIAKKDEADTVEGLVDCALTFDELNRWLQAENLTIGDSNQEEQGYRSRFFPTSGGIIKSLNKKRSDYQYISVDGVEACMSALDDIDKGDLSHCFIEMSMCEGSCVGGPVMETHQQTPLRDFLAVINYGGEEDIAALRHSPALRAKDFMPIQKNNQKPSDEEIKSILVRMGKQKKSDELNCGSCGYNTCQDKALAIYQGKADYTMCLPYLKERAESFFHNILDHTPSGIIVLNEHLHIQQFNDMAKKIFNIHRRRDVLGESVFEILNHKDLDHILMEHQAINQKCVYLAEYKKHIKESIIFDEDYQMILIIIDDISNDIKEKTHKVKMNKQTVEVADKVVEKQMRIVQEIASLLGETAAETKIALTQLKAQIKNE
ncbi:MAG TPA: [Fe-Fe] hydrogenase large subunit C-terminal domain-containing protein [Candidatus Izemoplasmatales bacterium]|nr:[Fe-Fe] hydrogenase large subunit C-terminal domain-containing protein [Candidatus Izemoplasmatales bacterium]